MQHYHHKQRGYILLITLIFSQIFAWLVLLEMRNLVVFLQSQANIMQSNDHEQMAFYSTLANYDWQHSPCLIDKIPSKSARMQSITWWQTHACMFLPNEYFYIENLQVVDCAKVLNNNDNQLITAQYYRVTLAIFNQTTIAQLQQSTYAKSQATRSICQPGNKHYVVLGRQMMRQI